jgi:hypothetical protein
MKRLRILLMVAAMAVAMPMMQACSSQQQSPPPDQQTQAQPPPPADPVEPDSVLGSAFHFVGTVVMFPFRLIGDTLGLLV